MVEIRVSYALISGIQGGIFEKTCEQVLISGVGGLSISGAVDKTVDNFRDGVDKGGLINI